VSGGDPIPYGVARRAATALRDLLLPACERIEIAGSVRRQKPVVHDLEIVAISRSEARGGLWGDADEVDLLGERLRSLREEGLIALRSVEVRRATGEVEVQTRDGAAYKALAFDGLPVDLFITDAERWGCIFALRTGPGDWNTRLVTDCKRYFRAVADGRVLHFGKPVPTPEEADFFRALGVPWLDPWERHVDALRFERPADA
jgi:DNA polymerase/3'-5' exonuclease PolX